MHPDTRPLKARGGEAAEPRQQPPVCSCVVLARCGFEAAVPALNYEIVLRMDARM